MEPCPQVYWNVTRVLNTAYALGVRGRDFNVYVDDSYLNHRTWALAWESLWYIDILKCNMDTKDNRRPYLIRKLKLSNALHFQHLIMIPDPWCPILGLCCIECMPLLLASGMGLHPLFCEELNVCVFTCKLACKTAKKCLSDICKDRWLSSFGDSHSGFLNFETAWKDRISPKNLDHLRTVAPGHGGPFVIKGKGQW